jgi:hypothetical protein
MQTTELTLDSFIEKILPVIGALLFVVGLGYLLYTSVWPDLDTGVRLGLGFFLSGCCIAGGYAASDRYRYLADVTIGG